VEEIGLVQSTVRRIRSFQLNEMGFVEFIELRNN